MKHNSWILGPALALVVIGATFKLSHAQNTAPTPTLAPAPKIEAPRPPASPQLAPQGTSTPAMQAPAAGQPPAAGQKRLSYNACNVEGPYIALTFDDGPSATLTPRLLDMLKARGIKATFFVLGQCVVANPDVLKRAAAEGHEIGNHSWDHKALTKGGPAAIAMEVNQTNAAIEQACGKRPTLIRPPYGATNTSVTKRLNEDYGLKVILWDVDPLDWKVRNSAHVTSEILKHTQDGSIILAHDIHPSTIEAMPATLDALLKKGFKFVTVSELIAMDRPQLPPKKEAPAAPTPAKAPSQKKH